MFRRIVDGVEYLAIGCAVVTVGLMLFYKPGGTGTYRVSTATASGSASASGSTGGAAAVALSGAAVYTARCSGCHGSKGEGGLGPKLSGGAAVRHFPNAADEIAVVTNGRGSMPAWQGTLTPDQIQAVVEYTRSGLGG